MQTNTEREREREREGGGGEYNGYNRSCTTTQYYNQAHPVIVLCYTVLSTHREGKDADELLERQADMIRYLQQHTDSLGCRIMEMQLRTLE